ncbi:adaptor complexes medium subunit family protein (macronuclear) [Tetrahymena thermophila SB210]|uniref:Adaptor complexes medium subunit family protein n=1 Tax=Tetrahymena thermophila (strain SB210) TaxID=312017 RepID=Q24HW4_TETTS|nr:adaptor complexes medium subunit family protein [Tetrahymena thermophila SB210]EAS07474.2 adaptor complexes medium subunit family protein [Tetrahymena thermophila SB210]|eukprot:XP_001027716.2 adaptor complexes medium subunit family protein [Tetrahymena thermophila SB210]
MTIDSIYIIAQNSEIIAYKNYFGQNRRKIAEEFCNQYSKSFKNHSTIEAQYPLFIIQEKVCIFHSLSDFIILFILNSEEQLLSAQQLMYLVADILKNTYKEILNSEKLKSNFSSLLIMLDHFMEKGQPLITQKQVLESLVQPQGVLDKIEEVVIGQNQHQNENFKVLEKYIDGLSDVKDNHLHRIKDLKCREEILFDVVEFVDSIIDRQGNLINNEINGEIKMECHLSQYPLVNVYMTIPQKFDDLSVHECLLDQADKFEADKILSFNPPSGSCSLLYYNIKTNVCRLPFNLIHHLEITKDTVKINFKLNAQPIRGQEYKTEDFYVKIILPSEMIQKEINVKKGNVSTNDNSLIWRVGTIPKDESLTFQAILQDKNQQNMKNSTFVACLKFTIPDYSVSGTKIDKATVKNSAENQRRLARNISKSGHYEIRLN